MCLTNTNEVKLAAHLVGFYRQFIEGLASRASLLTKVMQATEPWMWGAEQQQSFEDLRLALTSKPVLQYPDFNKPLVVATDASHTDVGAVVRQDHGGGLQPVAFASDAYRKSEANYGVLALKCMVMVWVLEQFRSNFYGRLITLITDHAVLMWLLEKKGTAGHLEMNV